MIEAIIYTSNTGYTARYAQLLGRETGLPVHSLGAVGNSVRRGAEIIYLGWLMAGTIKGYKKAAKTYRVRAVCAVGMGPSGSQLAQARKQNAIPPETELFVLRGGFDYGKLRGVYRFMMGTMMKTVGRSLAKKPDRTPDEQAELDMLLHGGDFVGVGNLSGVLDWFAAEKSAR